MAVLRDRGIVLRTQKLGEADRIVTVLTATKGLRRIVARGVRKIDSRFGGRLEPFSIVDIQFYEGRSLDSVNQVETVALYGPEISAQYDKYQAGTVMLETAGQLTEAAPSVQHFRLLAGALRALAATAGDPQIILDSYLLRALSLGGWEMQLGWCANCQSDGAHHFFSVAAGGAVCQECAGEDARLLSEGSLELLAALLAGDWDTVKLSTEVARRQASSLITGFVRWQLDRGLKSLR